MKIDLLCSNPEHPVVPWLSDWAERTAGAHDVALLHSRSELRGGDVLFLVSCTELIPPAVRERYRHALVLHASDLPRGRGWSPHVWEILSGVGEITVSLLDAEDPVDSGAIWRKRRVAVPRDSLHDEIDAALFAAELSLLDDGLAMIAAGKRPTAQTGEATWYRRRTPADSELDPERPLAELFDAIRVADPVRYPAFFRLRGSTYRITLTKVEDDARNPD